MGLCSIYKPIIHNGLNINEDLIDKNQVCYLNFLNVIEILLSFTFFLIGKE